MTEPADVRRRRWSEPALLVIPGLAILIAGVLVIRSLTADGTLLPTTPTSPIGISATTPGETLVTGSSPTTPPSTAPVPQVAGFPTSACVPAPAAAGGGLGIGIPRPARLSQAGAEKTAFEAALACLGTVSGTKPLLRTQLPIDVTRRRTPGDDEMAELTAFGALLNERGADGVVSVRSHDFARCGKDGAPKASGRASLPEGAALSTCQYPSIPVYEQLFGELRDALKAAAPGAEITFTAWNEPDHQMFTLRDAFGEEGAAERAGEYWRSAAGIAGADRVLAGEFSDRDLPTLLRLRAAFVRGTGGLAPAAWALHPYRDLTTGTTDDVVAGFERAVAPAPVWLTEVTTRLSGRGGLNGRPQLQRARGISLRKAIATKPLHVMLYLLTPPAAPSSPDQDDWDSALADRAGQARPFICGLAALPAADCPGSPSSYGGG